ncbi:MAG: DNA polymerase III subunit delta [Blautia sp.]|nr:DNA polymerase III subunit delta [Blautia sp.]
MKNIQEDLKSGNFRQIYLLYGEEDYLIVQYRDKLLKALVPEDDTLNFSRYEGKDINVREVIDLCETIPFLSERRVILFENSGFFKNKCDELADYLPQIPDYLYLIFVEKQVDKRSRMYKALKDRGRAAEFTLPDENTLLKWMASILGKSGKKIRTNDIMTLLQRTGSDMANIRNELDKLIGYTGDRDTVTLADIDAVCTNRLENQVFKMVRAVADKDQKKALSFYEDLLALKEPPLKILFNMAREFRLMLLTKQMEREGTTRNEIASVLSLKPFAVQNLSRCGQRYTISTLEKITEDFAATDEDVKTGRLDDRLAVELMIVKCSK